jgi:hypothetical protein
MKKIFVIILIIAGLPLSLNAQKFMTKNGYIRFYGHTPLENIIAENNQVASIIDASNGEIVFQALVKSFHFEKALMEEHFNENYVESEKFPRTQFKGKITNLSNVNFSKPGKYDVNITGELTLHGVTRQITVPANLEVTGSGLDGTSKFNLTPEDFNITIPGVVREKVAKQMEVTVDAKYSPMK